MNQEDMQPTQGDDANSRVDNLIGDQRRDFVCAQYERDLEIAQCEVAQALEIYRDAHLRLEYMKNLSLSEYARNRDHEHDLCDNTDAGLTSDNRHWDLTDDEGCDSLGWWRVPSEDLDDEY